jgi:tetratricopeptide (TPR) repeat protein
LERTDLSDEVKVNLSSEVFRYAIPAARLLRSTGRASLAEKLPIQVKGTLREMVFHFYQDAKDYTTALTYAEQWLTLNPQDLEILLYQVRCNRNLGTQDSTGKASRLLHQLELRDQNKRFAAKISREKALLAEHRGDFTNAKAHYREGMRMGIQQNYIENHVGYAQVVLREIDEGRLGLRDSAAAAADALRCIEEAREISPLFDRVHLGTYVEVLILAGQEETAIPFLELAIKDRPDDSRLNYRMAEVLRKRGNYREAERYAFKAIARRAEKARIVVANIYFGEAMDYEAAGDTRARDGRLQDALDMLGTFKPEYGWDQEVADSIACKVLCALGRIEEAQKRIATYIHTDNPYTVYEQCRVGLLEADRASKREDEIRLLRGVIARIEDFRIGRELPSALYDSFATARAKLDLALGASL